MKLRTLFVFIGILTLIFLFPFLTTATAESQSKPIELKLATWDPPQIAVSKAKERWANLIEEKSGNRVKITFYWAQALAAYPDTYRATQSGIADMGTWVFGITSGLHSLNEFNSLPLLGYDSMASGTKVYHELRKKFPQLDAEFKGVKLLWSCFMPAYSFHSAGKEIRAPEDVRGMKIMAGAAWTDFAKSLGFVTIGKGPPDWYMSIQKGLVEAQFIHWPAAYAFKLIELFSSHTLAGGAGFGMQMQCMFMNIDAWNKLPDDIQKIIMDLQPWIQDEVIKVDTAEQERGIAQAKEMGHKMIYLTPEEIQLWTAATAPARDKWVAEMEAKGLPGKAIFEEAKRLIIKYNK